MQNFGQVVHTVKYTNDDDNNDLNDDPKGWLKGSFTDIST